ncbi:MAG TPA: CBS domain-containing protein [Symbiobacteriaceae bacterium]|nr:CBS domain-containing protein [Symbiobacteriaceae bacterium]
MTTARDLMRSCLVVREEATVADVIDRIGQWPVCMVVDSRDRVCGILTEHDLAKLVYQSGQYDEETSVAGHMPAFLGMNTAQLRAVGVGELMTEDPESISPDMPLEMILRVIFRNHRDVLPVVEGGRLLGVVHRMDAIKKVLG